MRQEGRFSAASHRDFPNYRRPNDACEARALWPEATSLFKFLECGRPLVVENGYNTMAPGDEWRQKQRKDLYETASVQICARATRVVVKIVITGVLHLSEHIYLPTNGGN